MKEYLIRKELPNIILLNYNAPIYRDICIQIRDNILRFQRIL